MTASQLGFAAVLGVVAVHRLGEVVVSRRRLRTAADGQDPGRVVAEPGLFPAMVLLHVASLTAPLAEVLGLDRPFTPALAAAATLVLALAIVLRVWTLRTIGQAWNVRVVVPEAAQVVTTGPYAWVRHPNYLVVVLELAALPLLHGAWLSALGLTVGNALVLARRIATEEAALARLPAWRAAMEHKARLVPGVF